MNVHPKAVFLSYASQDAGPARRICDALRAAGLEVWFDQSELRGGDAWDASIRKKIRECALFVPLVSVNTEARSEGYFRLEWKLAVDRSHLMADDQAFLLPVVIDDTSEATARVPDRFRERQWSRIESSEAASAFAHRAARLLGGEALGTATAPPRAATVAPHSSAHEAEAATPPGARAAAVREAPSVAVLPFVNMSRDEENEYFADGLSEELLNVLAKMRGLRVASRTSAFSFKGKVVDIPTVAQKLNVGTVLEGSVRKSGKRVRITAQLIDVASDSHLWSETYDRELDDIFAVQDDIAQAVVRELRTALLGEAMATVAVASAPASAVGASVTSAAVGTSTVSTDSAATAAFDVQRAVVGRSHDPEAFQLYLQGKFFGERTTQADTDRAIELFRRALAIDPEFALAWTGLSRIHQVQAGFGFAPIDEGYERARDAARRALRLAPDLPEAHVELGMVQEQHDWDWAAAGASFRRALELAPGDADALRAAAGHARIVGRLDEGLELVRKAAALDPLSPRTHRQLALLQYVAGQFDDAAASFQLALDLSPNSGLTHSFLALTRLAQGRADDALTLAQAESHDVFRDMAVAIVRHVQGQAAESEAALQALINGYAWTAAYQVAEVYAYRSEVDAAFEWLERAFTQRDPGVMFTATDPFLRSLHRDPRWKPFLQRIGLAQATPV